MRACCSGGALVAAVTAQSGNLTHRYYQLKADWMGVDQLNWWDRNAPLPGDDDRKFSWEEARDIFYTAYRAVHLERVEKKDGAEELIEAFLALGSHIGDYSGYVFLCTSLKWYEN